MAQLNTHQMFARQAAKMLAEENAVVKNINTDRKREFGEEVNGYKKGDTVRISIPHVPVVYEGSVFANGGTPPSFKEGEVSLTLNKELHVPVTFTAKEKALEVAEFKERVVRPCINSLGAKINSWLMERFTLQTPNVVGTWGTIPATRRPYREASSVLNQFLAPPDMRSLHFSSDANTELAEANATLFHTNSEIRKEFDENAVGQFAGFTFYEQQSISVHTNGAGAGYLVNGAAQTGSLLAVDTGTGPITAGSTIVIAGVNAVHPITGEDRGKPRMFVVTANYAGGAGNVAISPAITPTTATLIGTVTASPADGAAITIFGTASESAAQNLAFHRNAFAVAFAPLPVLASCEGYTATVDNVSVRVMTFGDGYQNTENTRVDVLIGETAVRPDHAVRITE